MEKKENLEDVSVSSKDNTMTELQVYGITGTIVQLLNYLKKYIMLTQLQIDLVQKNYQVRNILKELYMYEETKLVMDIRSQLDMVYVYTTDDIVVENFQRIRNKFEDALSYLTSNMLEQGKEGNLKDEDYISILEPFMNKLKRITEEISSKPIFEKF